MDVLTRTTLLPWSSLHVFLHGGSSMEDRCLTDVIVPAMEELAATRPDVEWFFIRYWDGGPHLRLRVRGTDDEASALEALLRAWASDAGRADAGAAAGERGWQDHGEVARIAYEPEVQRYGGPDGLAASERFFRESSEVAAAVVARTPAAGGGRAGVALELLMAFALGATSSSLEAVRLLRSYASGLRYVGEGDPVDVTRLVQSAEAEFIAKRAALMGRFERLSARLAGTDAGAGAGAGISIVDHWAGRVRSLAATYRSLAADDRLAGDPSWILLSQLHMFHNRLGITMAEECYLSWLASLLVAGADPTADFLADRAGVPDRAYHEASKMFSALPWDIPPPSDWSATFPRWGDGGGRRSAWGALRRVALPRAQRPGAAAAPLAEVLTARRSSYGAYEGPLPLEELAAVLELGAGVSKLVRFHLAADGADSFALRTYPSAGARYPVRVAVMARDVPGLAPGLYAYDNAEHALDWLAPLPPADDVVRCSSMFGPAAPADPGGGPAIDITNAPALLFLVGEFTYQREKYGIRSYRLVLQECGHLAQNLWLVATSVGLATVTLASFYDDLVNQLLFADGVNDSVLALMPLARTGPHTVTADSQLAPAPGHTARPDFRRS